MKTAYFTGLRSLEIGEAPMPAIGRPGEVLLRIDRVGVCGSDVHYYVHGRIGNQTVAYPATLGHECAGTVVDVGQASSLSSVEQVSSRPASSVEQASSLSAPRQVGNLPHNLRPGTRVAIDPAIVCGQCDQCRAGRENTCRNIQFLGSPGQAPGAVAEYHVLPAENCVPIPDDMSLDVAVLVEPLSIGLYAVRVSPLDNAKGTGPCFRSTSESTSTSFGRKMDQSPASVQSIGILGCGPIGLSVLLCAKAAVACKVYMTDLLDERLAVARACGADWSGSATVLADATTAIHEQEPLGLDVVFECSGDPACIDQAQQLLKPGGTLMLVGIPPTVEVQFDAHLMRTKELTFRSVRRQNGCVAPAVELLHSGRIDAAPLLTHQFPLDRIRDAFELVAGYRDGVIKAVVDLSGA
jgi:L-iditol 2-dehydrogenase